MLDPCRVYYMKQTRISSFWKVDFFFALMYIIITRICYTVYSLCIVKLICNLNSIISWWEGRSFLFCIFNYWDFLVTMKSLCFIQDSLVINSVESASPDGQWASQALILCLHYLLTVPALSSMHSEMLCGGQGNWPNSRWPTHNIDSQYVGCIYLPW